MTASEVALVALGGAIGSVLRHWISTHVSGLVGTQFPFGTLAVNGLGSFFIGVLVGLGLYGPKLPFGRHSEILLIVGVCGGFTTFSAFSLQTVELLERGRLASASLNIAASVFVCLVCVTVGLAVVRLLPRG